METTAHGSYVTYPIQFIEQEPIGRLPAPLVRVTCCGMMTLEVLKEVVSTDPPLGRYEVISTQVLRGRGAVPSMMLLKLLGSQPHRFATKDWLITQLQQEMESGALVRLDTVSSQLRKQFRGVQGEDASALGLVLVEYLRNGRGSGPGYQLAPYPLIWLDTDALVWNVEQAARMERFGEDALPWWERAYALASRGEYLPDDPYSEWAANKRAEVAGALRQCVHALHGLYLSHHGAAGAQHALFLLRSYWLTHQTDEDALRPLMELLGEQERYNEAEEDYQQFLLAFAELGPTKNGHLREPDPRTQDIREYLRTKQIQRTQKVQHSLIPISSTLSIDPHLPVLSTSAQESPVEVDLFHVGIMALILQQQQSGWNSNELEQQVMQALDSVIPEVQKTQHLSRRSILSFIVGMPLAFYSFATTSLQSAPSLVPEEVIPLYAAGIPACWRLYYEGGQIQLEQVLPRYLSHLTLLTENPSKLQKTAAGLLSQTYQLMALLAQGHERFDDAIEYCQQAAFYGQYAEDINLQVMAYIRLQDTYWERRAFDKCFVTLKQAELFAERTTPLLRGRIFARLANVYSYRSELASAQRYIDIAQHVFPQHPEMDPGFLYSHTTHFNLYANEVSTHIKMGQLQKAWDAITHAEKFVLGLANPRKIDVTQFQIQVATAHGDLEQCSALFEKLVYLVQQLGHELDKKNTYTLYQSLHKRWPHEERVDKMKQSFLEKQKEHY